MSLEKLLEAGGTAVGGVIYVGREAMGHFTADGFMLLEAGKAFLGAENSPVAPAEIARPAAKKAARVRAQAEPVAQTAQEPLPAEKSDDSELGELLP